MQIHGFQKLTLLDYPEHLAAVLFTGSCNFRCPFCQNAGLVLHPGQEPVIPEEEILSVLQKRFGRLTGVCITGGEPTLHADLPVFLDKIKAIGYQIKLDTNGTHPDMVKQLRADGLIDYVAMDIKASRENYPRVSGCPQLDPAPVQETINFLMSGSMDYEFRTTVVKGLHTEDDFIDIAEWISGCSRYYLQSFRSSEHILQNDQAASAEHSAPHSGEHSAQIKTFPLESYSPEEMQKFQTIIQRTIPNARLRGIDF